MEGKISRRSFALREADEYVAKFIRTQKLKFMPKKVRIPTPLRKLTNNEELVEINAAICF
jgi:hypothetical protein